MQSFVSFLFIVVDVCKWDRTCGAVWQKALSFTFRWLHFPKPYAIWIGSSIEWIEFKLGPPNLSDWNLRLKAFILGNFNWQCNKNLNRENLKKTKISSLLVHGNCSRNQNQNESFWKSNFNKPANNLFHIRTILFIYLGQCSFGFDSRFHRNYWRKEWMRTFLHILPFAVRKIYGRNPIFIYIRLHVENEAITIFSRFMYSITESKYSEMENWLLFWIIFMETVLSNFFNSFFFHLNLGSIQKNSIRVSSKDWTWNMITS